MNAAVGDTSRIPWDGWFSDLVTSWISREIRTDYTDSGFKLSVAGARPAILLPVGWCAGVYNASEPSFGLIDVAGEGFSGVLGDLLPAPGITDASARLVEASDELVVVNYSIPSLAYWMLNRIEEVGRTDQDQHGRFPATASHAFRHGYLERPLVDEWVEVLRQLVQRVWPGLPMIGHAPSIRVSHDVDSPSRYAFGGPGALLRTVAGDLVRRRQFGSLLRGPRLWLGSRARLHAADPSNTFDWIMDRSDEHGLVSAFYFICGRTDAGKDAAYDIEDARIRALLRRIHARGHEIGLHPSYATYRDPELIASEAARLRRVCSEEGIEQAEWGGRMHFLRWEVPTTLRGWEQAGMAYDTTMSYADRPGFRCGTCHEYPAFDPVAGRQLQLRIRPLVAMECTVMAPRYLGLGDGDAALAKFVELKRACHAVGGCFTTLWHNTYFEQQRHRDLYRALLAA